MPIDRPQQTDSPLITQPPGQFTFIDLFAGIGGFRRGFEKIGGKCVFSCEWDKYSRETYKLNNPNDKHEFGVDIRDYSGEPSRVPRHDLLLAGLPCFNSVAFAHRGA